VLKALVPVRVREAAVRIFAGPTLVVSAWAFQGRVWGRSLEAVWEEWAVAESAQEAAEAVVGWVSVPARCLEQVCRVLVGRCRAVVGRPSRPKPSALPMRLACSMRAWLFLLSCPRAAPAAPAPPGKSTACHSEMKFQSPSDLWKLGHA